MKLKALIIDDEPDALAKLRRYISEIPFLETAAECQCSSDAMLYLADNSVDVIFTDIDMPDTSGLAFVEALTERTMVVFITAYRDFALDAFRLSAIDYLLKPYSETDFRRAANKVLEVYRNRQAMAATAQGSAASDSSIFVKVETRYERINLSAIEYIKGYGEYLQIYTVGHAVPILTICSFADIMKRLGDGFVQVHRSYVVNMAHARRIEKNHIVISDKVCIPVSTTCRPALVDYMSSRSIGRPLK